MSNSNIKSFDNFHADLAQSAYNGRPSNFPYDAQLEEDKKKLDSGESIPFDFSKNVKYKKEITLGGGQDLPHGGKVYLQPDPDLHTKIEPKITRFPYLIGGEDNFNIYQKGLMTDEKAGFNSYFLTDSE